MIIEVPISLGELVDKITILEIKLAEITNERKLKNINYEYQLLDSVLVKTTLKEQLKPLSEELTGINRKIWDLENIRRQCETEQTFGEIFLDAVRGIHINNEERSRVKNLINISYGSSIVEEKSYTE